MKCQGKGEVQLQFKLARLMFHGRLVLYFVVVSCKGVKKTSGVHVTNHLCGKPALVHTGIKQLHVRGQVIE